MSVRPDNLDEALRAVAAGNLDALRPDQVAQLETLLNEEPALAAQLADRLVAPDALLASALAQAEQAAVPSAAVWEQAWERIGAAVPAMPATVGRRRRMVIRLWKPLAAVAACLLMVAGWKISSATPKTEDWPMQLATNVDIDQLEVYDGRTPFVFTSGGENGFEVIWVLGEDQG